MCTLQEEGGAEPRRVLLIEPERTPLAPLSARLLLEPVGSGDGVWQAARMEQVLLAAVLPRP